MKKIRIGLVLVIVTILVLTLTSAALAKTAEQADTTACSTELTADFCAVWLTCS